MSSNKIIISFFFNIYFSLFLNSQSKKEIIFTNKDNNEVIHYNEIYNNPDSMPRKYLGFQIGYWGLNNPILDNNFMYSCGLNFGYFLNKNIKFSSNVIIPIPDAIINYNSEYFGEPAYKNELFMDFNFHFNILNNYSTKYRNEILKEKYSGNEVTKYRGKIPINFKNNLLIDLGINNYNLYSDENISYEKKINKSIYEKIGNQSFINAKFGFSYLRTESRMFKADNFYSSAKTKYKRIYANITYLLNNTNTLAHYEKLDIGTVNTFELKKFKNDENINGIKPIINPYGFRAGIENLYFYPDKISLLAKFGFEFGFMPTVIFDKDFNPSKFSWMINLGLGICDKLKK